MQNKDLILDNTEINSKWTINLNVKLKSIKLPEGEEKNLLG